MGISDRFAEGVGREEDMVGLVMPDALKASAQAAQEGGGKWRRSFSSSTY